MPIQPYYRRYEYISDFYKTVTSIFASVGPAYPVTYYSVDWENSTYDNEYLNAGNYEKHLIGDKSGVLFNKIVMFPVYFVDQVTPSGNADEQGISLGDSEITNITIPSLYGILPIEEDCIQFNQEFMFNGTSISPLFNIRNVEQSSFGNIVFYKLQLKVMPNGKAFNIEKQINNNYMFFDFDKQIHPITNSSYMLSAIKKCRSIISVLNENFHPSGYYAG